VHFLDTILVDAPLFLELRCPLVALEKLGGIVGSSSLRNAERTTIAKKATAARNAQLSPMSEVESPNSRSKPASGKRKRSERRNQLEAENEQTGYIFKARSHYFAR